MDDKEKNLREIEADLKKNMPPGQSKKNLRRMAEKIWQEGQNKAK